MANKYRYESAWREYEYPRQLVEFSYLEDIIEERKLKRVNLCNNLGEDTAGLPIWSDGQSAYMNGETEMSLIFGGTGSKKTRTLVSPLICNLAMAKENMIVVDVKGELSTGALAPYIRSTLTKQNYKQVFLDFRTYSGDAYNLLGKAMEYFEHGNEEMANKKVRELATLLTDSIKSEKDPSWAIESCNFIVNAVMILMKHFPKNFVNLESVAKLADLSSVTALESFFEDEDKVNIADSVELKAYKSYLNLPTGHRGSIFGLVSGSLSPFTSNSDFSKMMSIDTFSVKDLYANDQPTAVFLIVPDEHKTYDTIVGVILSEIVNELMDAAYKNVDEHGRKDGKLKRRINFICDEFCNYRMPNMERYISAHRSRNIRWYLVCQGITQLRDCYPKEHGTILGNCVNQYFLSTPDIECANYIVSHSGIVNDNPNGKEIPLVSLAQLSGMRKGDYTECFLSMRGKQLVVELPDIALYANSSDKPYFDYSENGAFGIWDIENRVGDAQDDDYCVLTMDIFKDRIESIFSGSDYELMFDPDDFNDLYDDEEQ